ncbi:conserved hypothetical protein [Theileria orientalis strain Shintoku]|uniref:Uncharacterized protein n=1 Tax=Theileria orientalis strain Shintoku TaxID=869250 RepID=J4C4B5_THEOR|nr:conserved hypothetical protein [Theileria orientalis strain Shintoku]BAM41896.1 conserved hypothetical protein [Theileria orientalis strain Shintoku]|eukprot:XP_009692197.1 conserved hypothetical protein [Theileria orientalis strain Shintoku]
MAYIYLGTKSGKYDDHHTEYKVRYKYSVKVSTHLIEQCPTYYYIKYSIQFYVQGYTIQTNNFDIVICDGTTTHKKGKTKFKYESNKHYDIPTVDVYYSMLFSDKPLVVCFNTKHFGQLFHRYSRLKDVKNIKGRDLENHTVTGDLYNVFHEELRKISSALILYSTFAKSAYVKHNPSDLKNHAFIGDKKKFYSITFTSINNTIMGMLYTDLLIQKTSENPSGIIKLSDIEYNKGLLCDGVVCYYTIGDHMPLYIEVIDKCSIIQYIRKDLDECFYKETIVYMYYSGVEFLLEYILTNIESKVRYKLNKNSRYTGNILVTPTLKENYKFYIYKHTPFLGHEKKNCEIWYNTHKIIVYSDDVESDKLSNVENLIYNKIETYSLVISSDFHLLIKFTSTSGKAYYLQRVDTSGKYWNQILISDYELKDDKLFRSKLDEFSYVLKKSIMVHIDEEPGHYEMYLVDNTDRIGYEGFYQEKTHESQIIEVVNEKNCSLFKQSHFTMHTHNLSQSKNSAELERIGGLRLFVTGNQKDQSILVYKEVKIYKNVDTNESNRIFLTYTPGPGRPFQETNNDNVYVFFHDEDPRPLMLSYNDKAYRARNEKEYESYMWPVDKAISSSNCHQRSNTNLLNTLNEICYYLKIRSCREGSPKYPPTTISERDPHSTISVTTELKPHSQPPPQQPLPPVHPPPPSGHIPPPSKEEKTKQKPHVLVQKPEVTKSTHDHGRPKGYHTDTRDSESKVSSSSPKSTVQVDQRHSVTAQRRDDHIQTSESPRGTTNLMEELTPPAPRPPSSPKLPESTPMNPPSQGSDRTTKVPEPSLRASGSPHSKGTEGRRLSIEESVTHILPKNIIESRSITHSKPSKVTQPDLPRAEARQATHDSTANDTSDTKTTIIASSTTAGVVVAGGATGTLVYLKFPYIFYPAIKALL